MRELKLTTWLIYSLLAVKGFLEKVKCLMSYTGFNGNHPKKILLKLLPSHSFKLKLRKKLQKFLKEYLPMAVEIVPLVRL